MLIYNKKTGVTQECHNKDVIKVCKKNPDIYTIMGEEETKENGNDHTRNLDTLPIEELKKLAKEKGLEGYSSLTKEELISVLKDVV